MNLYLCDTSRQLTALRAHGKSVTRKALYAAMSPPAASSYERLLTRRLVEIASHHYVSTFRNPSCPVHFTGREAAARQTDIRSDASRPLEARWIPALIALFRDIVTDEPKAILRRDLTSDGRKFGPKPLYLGPMAGCAIKLTANEDVCQGLHVAEGVETAIAAMMLGFTPMWALGGTGSLRNLPVLAGIDALTIVVDNDRNGAGQIAASECFDRWTAVAREVWSIIPDDVGNDLNDVITSVPAA
jgi:hypothetical protein